jgi:anti-sigma B factor antagonist
MKLKKRERSTVVVFDLFGDMYADEKGELIQEIESLSADGKLNLVINLAKVKRIASNGLGVLVAAQSRYAKNGGAMKICKANERVLTVLAITKLNLLFDVYPSEEEALAAFESA